MKIIVSRSPNLRQYPTPVLLTGGLLFSPVTDMQTSTVQVEMKPAICLQSIHRDQIKTQEARCDSASKSYHANTTCQLTKHVSDCSQVKTHRKTSTSYFTCWSKINTAALWRRSNTFAGFKKKQKLLTFVSAWIWTFLLRGQFDACWLIWQWTTLTL